MSGSGRTAKLSPRLTALTALAALLSLLPRGAEAQEPAPQKAAAACTESFEHAQVARKQGKLLAARSHLHACVQSSCPALIVKDCTQWLDEVESSVPSVVPAGADESGMNLADVSVSIDGVPSKAPAGQAIDLDPGMHHFEFQRADLTKGQTDVLVIVGQKNKPVVVTLRRAPQALHDGSPEGAHAGAPIGTIGLVVAGAGVVGLGVGAGFGIAAMGKQSDANCPKNVCRPGSNPQALENAGTLADVSTVFFVAGGVLAAAGITTWILAPSRRKEPAVAWVVAAPTATTHGGGLGVIGAW